MPTIALYYAPRTRAVRIRWLLEELGLPHELRRVPFTPPATVFSQSTPLGKFPVLVDGELTMGESGAILQYLLERYGESRLAPPIGTPARGLFLQWVHFAESTAYPPLGNIIWYTFYQGNADELPAVIEDARARAHAALAVVEEALRGKEHLLGDFSAADVMMGFTVAAATLLGLVSDDRHPNLAAYLRRLEARPAYQRAVAD